MQSRWVCAQVAKAFTYFQYEDVVPAAVLHKRTPAVGEDGPTMYLISWRDDAPDSWVPEEFVSDEVWALPLPPLSMLPPQQHCLPRPVKEG